MAENHVERLKKNIKQAIKECEEAINKVASVYQEEKQEFASMSQEEEREFLVAAFIDTYKEIDARLEFRDVIDAIAINFVIPQVVDQAFKLSSPAS